MLLDQKGQVLAHTDRSRLGQYVRDLPREARPALLAHSETLVDAIAPAMLGGHPVGWARVGINQQVVREKLAVITRNGVLYALAAIAIGSILALLMGNRLTRKLYAIRRVSETVRAGRQEARVPDLGGDEAGQLARDFNAMLDGLSSSEKRFTNIVNLATDAIISVDENQRICSFNTGAEQIFGYTTAEILGQLLDRLLPEHLAEAHREHIRRFAAGPDAAREMNRRAEIHGRRKDGTEFPAEASISKVKQNGKFQFTVFLRDITERRQAEEKIRKLSVELRQFKDTLDQTLDCVFMFRPDTLRFTYVNEGAKRQIGYNEAELLQMTPVDIKPEFSLERFQHVLRPMIDGVQPSLTFQTVHRHKDGHDIPVEIFLQLVRLEGQEPRFVAMVRDITERKRIEEEIRQLNASLEHKVIERTAELLAANQELEAFSYSVSHDLRAPLRSIDGFSQALLEDYADRLDDPGRGHLNRVRAATQRMGHLIDDLIKLARVTRTEMKRETVNLSALASDVIEELRKNEPERQVDWHVEPDLVTEGDDRLLRVAIENLLGNAWKFTGKTANAMIEFGAARAPTAHRAISCATTAPASTWPTPANCSVSSSACTPWTNFPAPASDSPPSSASSAATAATCARRASPAPARRSISHFRNPTQEAGHDRKEQDDTTGGRQPRRRGADLARAAQEQHPERRDGGARRPAGARLFLRRGRDRKPYTGRGAARPEATQGGWPRSAVARPRRRAHPHAAGGDPHLLQGGTGPRQRLPPRRQQLHPQAGGLRPVHGGGAPPRPLLAGAERNPSQPAGTSVTKPLRALIVEDSEDDTELLRELRRGGYDPFHARVDAPEAMRAELAAKAWDIVFSDFTMPNFNAFDALALLHQTGLDIPFIIVSGTIGEDRAVMAMKAGAHDYILKGNLKRLVPAVERELKEAEVRRERWRAEERSRYLAHTDPVTDLPNRIRFHQQVQQAVATSVREGRTMALLLMDLERFKEVNNTLGHNHGDQLLRQVGQRLRGALFPPDTVARLGGDEFGILLPRLASPDDVTIVCKKNPGRVG